MVEPADIAAVSAQLGRQARDIEAIAHRCSCGKPDVVKTKPRLGDGTPFPTTYYLTCPRATAAVSTLESQQVMKDMEARLSSYPELQRAYTAAHEAYLSDRNGMDVVPEIDGITAGGMPSRVKCLHVLVAHALAAGPGVNPFGDEALAMLSDWGNAGPCVEESAS